jgi:dihydrolipoamide dehydrogenase
MDGEVAKAFQRVLAKQGFEFHLSTKVVGVKSDAKGVSVETEPAAGGDRSRIEGDVVLMAIGRKPHTEGLGLDVAGVALDSRGRIETDAHFRTNVPGIFAIGDVIAGAMLAHKAEDEGVAVAEILVGQAGHVNHDTIPGVVYTNPEVASVGKTEEELKAAGVAYAVGKFPFSANGRALSMDGGDNGGFVRIVARKSDHRVLGIQAVGKHVSELSGEFATALEMGALLEDVAGTIHVHPTLSEAFHESALKALGHAIHI